MFCSKCGKPTPDGYTLCMECIGKENASKAEEAKKKEGKFLPSFILGLIASIFGIFGGICMTMCSSLYSSGGEAFILILGGSVVGLVGTCKCLSDAKMGGILQLVATVMIVICAYGITGADIATVVAMILFGISGLLAVLHAVKNKK